MGHIPVLLQECIEGLNIDPDGIYLDGTLGRGGHSAEIAARLKTGRLIAVDRDQTAIDEAGKRLSEYSDKITFVHGNFRDIDAILDGLKVNAVNGMVFDLGVSSPQLDDSGRGFSYMFDAPLDMRMDRSDELSAFDVVNDWTEDKLRRILFEYGEERYAPRIAGAIVRRRQEKKIETTAELSDIIRAAMPAAARREKQHPAKRSFQAIRIAVNDELSSITDLLDKAPDRLLKQGRLCVISFHSLEDRLVKNAFLSRERGCKCPPGFPVCVCGFIPTLKTITKKPVLPDQEEIDRNPRSRSAKLRIAERV
jgi:16S rRNA (cytosine1402-N4)-methyltransferase